MLKRWREGSIRGNNSVVEEDSPENSDIILRFIF